MTGHPTNQTALSISEAINMARKHRDQLVAAVAVIDQLPTGAGDDAYLVLQNKLDEVAPDVCRLAWGHKYVSLLFPRMEITGHGRATDYCLEITKR
jgi:5-methylcytosine-specific restriction protein B